MEAGQRRVDMRGNRLSFDPLLAVIKLSSKGFNSFLEKQMQHVLVILLEKNLTYACVLFYVLQTIFMLFILLDFTDGLRLAYG